jgi:hypothetical protein
VFKVPLYVLLASVLDALCPYILMCIYAGIKGAFNNLMFMKVLIVSMATQILYVYSYAYLDLECTP